MSSARAGHRVASAFEKLAERLGLDLEFRSAGTFSGNAQKFNVHGASPSKDKA